jgi:hypothetical protein
MRRALVTVTLITVLAAASTLTAFAAGEDESDRPRHRLETVFELMDDLGGGFLGVQLTEITPELRTFFGVPDDVGVMVSRVVADSPAERAGLKVGDVIARAGDEDVDSSWSLKRAVSRHGGEAMVVEVWRDGQMQNLTATLENREVRRAVPRVLALDCEGDDCEHGLVHRLMRHRLGQGALFGCGDREDCDLTVRCEDGDCECTLNGEAADCEALRLHWRSKDSLRSR